MILYRIFVGNDLLPVVSAPSELWPSRPQAIPTARSVLLLCRFVPLRRLGNSRTTTRYQKTATILAPKSELITQH
jgi:hypothetical protein